MLLPDWETFIASGSGVKSTRGGASSGSKLDAHGGERAAARAVQEGGSARDVVGDGSEGLSFEDARRTYLPE